VVDNDTMYPTMVPVANVCNAGFVPGTSPLYNEYNIATNAPSDFMLDQIRTSLFYTSVQYSAAERNWNAIGGIPNPDADIETFDLLDDVVTISVYKVGWKWWWESVAVTVTIVLFILPTFYGFWMFTRKTTLSPFETARAFNAPILNDTSPDIDTSALLKAVGKRNVHADHGPVVEADTTEVEKTL
jgi:hypothetical protein